MEKIEAYKKQINTKQNLALLIELISVLGKYGNIESPFQIKEEYGFQFDISNTLFLNLYTELQNDLIARNFKIDLENTNIEGLHEDLILLEETDPVLSKRIYDLYRNMANSFRYIKHRTETNSINLITLLLENGQAEKVVELIVSENVPNALKKDILQNIIANYPKALKKIFKIVPSSYYYFDGKTDYKERFKSILDQNFAEVLNDVYIEDTIRTMIKSKYTDEDTIFKVKDVVEFFIEHNLVKINDITWSYEEYPKVSSAAAGYITGNNHLGKYLYSLPSYQQTESTTRLDSDKAILQILLERSNKRDFDEFIKHINYESMPEKLNHLMQVILQAQPMNPEIIDSERLDTVIEILLRKTKKQDYKEMQSAITDIKTNTDISLLNEKRKEFAKKLRIVSDSLLDQVPATKVIKDLNFAGPKR